MRYEESEKILKAVRESAKILVNVHKSPDPDSVGCALAMYKALSGMGKQVEVVCPDGLPRTLEFLPDSKVVRRVDFSKFDFSGYDLFLCLDTGSIKNVLGPSVEKIPDIDFVVIDHHKTSANYGKINLVDSSISSCAEIIHSVFKDWGVFMDKDISQCLLTGIIGDTGGFQYPQVSARTFTIASELVESGADREEIVFNIFRRVEIEKIRLWGEILRDIKVDGEHKFVWAAVSWEDYSRFLRPESAKEMAASMFMQIVEGTDFGMMMIEETKGTLAVSLRSRTDFDVSEIAEKFGGGGHRSSAGCKVSGLNFKSAVEKVLEAAKESANESTV